MRLIYSLIVFLLTPVLFGYFLVRGIRDRRWLKRWGERLGRFDAAGSENGLVVHAASVGEVNAAAPLIEALMVRFPERPLTITCFTPTGSARVDALFKGRVRHVYAPLDLPGAVRRFMKRLQPGLLLVMETEIWPNLFARARKKNVPLIISNARLTERSARGWSRFSTVVEEALAGVSLVAAQSEADAARYIQLGARPEHTQTLGNLKFDIALPADLPDRAQALRAKWGNDRSVLVAGSTHADDERPLLAAFTRLLKTQPDALLVMAPRYPERFSEAAGLATKAGLRCEMASSAGPQLEGTQCLVIDTMGELLTCYAASDITFIGGTLAEVGGHNPLEAAALGKPVLFGPNTQHVRDTACALVEQGGALEVADSEGLYEAWSALCRGKAYRAEMGRAALALVKQKQGAVSRTLQVIDKLLNA